METNEELNERARMVTLSLAMIMIMFIMHSVGMG